MEAQQVFYILLPALLLYFSVFFFFLPMILGMFEAFWSHITDDMFCEYFHTVSFCNANGRDSVNKWKGRRMLNG